MVALINQLADLGLVERALDRADRRAFSLELSQAGHEMVTATLDRIVKRDERLLSALALEERETLLALLKKVHGRPCASRRRRPALALCRA
jgi:MarR family transcriptional regulator, lower aerobic nicotinate degradation pathway regulator